MALGLISLPAWVFLEPFVGFCSAGIWTGEVKAVTLPEHVHSLVLWDWSCLPFLMDVKSDFTYGATELQLCWLELVLVTTVCLQHRDAVT